MVQSEVVKGILKRDPTVLGMFEYDFNLILSIKQGSRKSKFKDKIEYIEAMAQAKEPINLEMELRRAVMDHYFNKI